MWSTFCWGLLVGFLLEWLCDWIFWRKARPVDAASQSAIRGASFASKFGAGQTSSSQNAMGLVAGAVGAGAGVANGVSANLVTPLPSGIASYRESDLEAIEGIGPKIAELMHNAGVKTFAQLAATPMDKLVAILDAGGPRFKLANPATWGEQATLAAKGDWVGFDRLKKELVAGVRSSDV